MSDGLPGWGRIAVALVGGLAMTVFCGLRLFHELLNEMEEAGV